MYQGNTLAKIWKKEIEVVVGDSDVSVYIFLIVQMSVNDSLT